MGKTMMALRSAFSALVRRARAESLRIPKAVSRATATEDQYRSRPPIVVNSIPKSGTHLLLQLALALPGYKTYGSFIATTPSVTMWRRSNENLSARIRRLVPGEACGAHLYYSESVRVALAQRGAISLFIYRDPRDIFWSEMQYLLSMNPWHRSARKARQISNADEQFQFFLRGQGDVQSRWFEWPRFSKRVEPYLGWLTDPNTFCCRYEDFKTDEGRERVLEALADHLRQRIATLSDVERGQVTQQLRESIKPQASHTFRSGRQHEWRSHLTSSQIEALEEEVSGLNLIFAN